MEAAAKQSQELCAPSGPVGAMISHIDLMHMVQEHCLEEKYYVQVEKEPMSFFKITVFWSSLSTLLRICFLMMNDETETFLQ